MKIGILGGTFDPPHIGHLNISLEAIKRFQLNKVRTNKSSCACNENCHVFSFILKKLYRFKQILMLEYKSSKKAVKNYSYDSKT